MTTPDQLRARETAMITNLSVAVKQARDHKSADYAKGWADAQRFVWKMLGAA